MDVEGGCHDGLKPDAAVVEEEGGYDGVVLVVVVVVVDSCVLHRDAGHDDTICMIYVRCFCSFLQFYDCLIPSHPPMCCHHAISPNAPPIVTSHPS